MHATLGKILARSWQDLDKRSMHLGKRAKIRVTGWVPRLDDPGTGSFGSLGQHYELRKCYWL